MERIFGLAPASQPASLDVGEDVSDDLAEVGGAQRPLLQVFTVLPAEATSQHSVSNCFPTPLPNTAS